MKIQNQYGQGLIEYLILVALIAVATMAAMQSVGHTMGYKFGLIAKSLGAKVENQPDQPVVSDAAWKKKDMRNFMTGAVGRNRTETSENDTD